MYNDLSLNPLDLKQSPARMENGKDSETLRTLKEPNSPDLAQPQLEPSESALSLCSPSHERRTELVHYKFMHNQTKDNVLSEPSSPVSASIPYNGHFLEHNSDDQEMKESLQREVAIENR